MSAPISQTEDVNVATRVAYGKKLLALGKVYPEIVVLDADLSGSTQTNMFAKEFPERFINFGVAEQDMMASAAGLAHSGKIVFASSFAMFATGRAWEIVRNSICYPHFNVKICASHAGITLGEDGASHQIIEDIAIMRVIPGMKVFVPADFYQTQSMMDYMLRDSSPTYLRLGRQKVNAVFGPDYKFQAGKGDILRRGEKIALLVTGFPTGATLKAADILAKSGMNPTVACFGSVKPIDADLISELASTHDILFSIEEHNVLSGFGAAVAEVVCERSPRKLIRLGLQDEFGQSGTADDLLKHYKLDAAGIAQSVQEKVR